MWNPRGLPQSGRRPSDTGVSVFLIGMPAVDRGALCRPFVHTFGSAGVYACTLGCEAAKQDACMPDMTNVMVLASVASLAYDPASRLGDLKSPSTAAIKQG